MPGSEATSFVSNQSGVLNPASAEGLPSAQFEESFESAWEDLLGDIKSRNKAIEKEERFESESTTKAFEIAFSYPEQVSITVEPFGRSEDMTDHLQHHFDLLINNDDVGASLKSGSIIGDIDYLLRFCELAFLDDSMYRFAKLQIFDPEVDGLQSVGFIGLPVDAQSPFIDQWHQDMEIIYNILLGNLKESIRIKEKIDQLYEMKTEFISHCRNRDVFLPITIDAVGDPETKEKHIKTRLRRGAEVPPKIIHKYCYLQYRRY